MPNPPTDMPALISGFLNNYLSRERGLSQRTIASYSQTLILLFRFLAARYRKTPEQLWLKDINLDVVLEFLKSLELERGNSASSRNLRLAAIKCFFRYSSLREPAAAEQAARVRAIELKKTGKPIVDYLTKEEITAVIEATNPRSALGRRDKAMLFLTFACGLRVSETLGVTLGDVQLGANPTVNVLGKGRRARVLPLWNDVADCLQSWIAIRPAAASSRLFLNQQNAPLTRDGFAHQLSKYVAIAARTMPGLRNRRVTPHVLRHSCAMRMLKATKDIRKVSLWLGHSSIQSTECYLHADPEEKLNILLAHESLGIKAGRFSDRATNVMSKLEAARSMKHA